MKRYAVFKKDACRQVIESEDGGLTWEVFKTADENAFAVASALNSWSEKGEDAVESLRAQLGEGLTWRALTERDGSEQNNDEGRPV